MQKLLKLFIALSLTVSIANATEIDKAISKSNIHKSAISISIKNVKNGNVVYKLNEKKPMIPASTLKIITLTTALDELGKDYEFSTELYKNTNNELIFKLGADPFLTSRDLRTLLETAKSKNIFEPKAVKIDDSILDKTEWGEGWQWDDDLNPLMPKFSAYNLDKNLLNVTISPTTLSAPANIKLDVFYPVTFMNLVVSQGEANSVKISRNNSIAPNIINVEGNVINDEYVQIPVNNMKMYFILQLENAMRKVKLGYYGTVTNDRMKNKNEYLVDKITNKIDLAITEIMLNSNNLIAETIFKIAGGHSANSTGTIENSIELFHKYCQKNNIDYSDIKITDGSGVSKNNLITTDFMTRFLANEQQKNTEYKDIFASAGQGTLKNRMLYFGENLKAKTGTLSDVSAIAGFITTKCGNTYAFDIMINDPKSSSSDKKMLEEYILRAVNTSY